MNPGLVNGPMEPALGLELVNDVSMSQQPTMVMNVTTVSDTAVIEQALAVIDKELPRLVAREMITASDVTNVLLDLRLLLAPAVEPEPVPTVV